AQFSKPFHSFGNMEAGKARKSRRISGKDVRGFVQFGTAESEKIMIKVGLSFVSAEGAKRNLEKEMPDWDFEHVKKEAEKSWNTELGKIEVDGGTAEQRKTFYTALYHTMIAPNVFSDVDGKYLGMDGKIHTAKGFEMYTVFSLWDTFRTLHPLLTLIDQRRTADFVQSLLEKYDESGILPVWELCGNETWCMIGYHSVPVILDAYIKGVRGFDAEKAFRAMKTSAMKDHYGLKAYRDSGLIPGEHESESVSKTLEYAYDDWCIAQMALLLNKHDEFEYFSERSQFYKNVFDRSVGFMRGKQNGSWVEPFDATAVTVFYTEANAWQYSFFVPHDIDGLIREHGGNENFERSLDRLFSEPSRTTGREQADITGMIGQYAQGNEPSHHVAYLYNYCGAPWKTQSLVRKIMDSLYSDTPAGLCGNDDCGQISAWYVMSALGFYPVTPGKAKYTIGSPLFERAAVKLESGKSFVIEARNTSNANNFVQSISLNGMPYNKLFLDHVDITRGGTLSLTTGNEPNTRLHGRMENEHSPVRPIVAVPVVEASGRSFVDSIRISLKVNPPDANIFFKLEPGMSRFVPYTAPLQVSHTCTLRAFAAKDGFTRSKEVEAVFHKRKQSGTIVLRTKFSPQYPGGGNEALVDGIRGVSDFRVGGWQGFEQNDLDATIDLGTIKRITEVSLGCLQDNNAWIFFPSRVEFSFSEDGKVFRQPVEPRNDVSPNDPRDLIKEFNAHVSTSARFVKVNAKNIGLCPPWHKGAGKKAWLFVDEISIKTEE
ncbi:MAG: glycoside hydrolase family 92 protein, partial [Ignavibacteriales bacterium]|nr:glycoside hydrolase family 92 protein [Ignavibacteriales bacterium]